MDRDQFQQWLTERSDALGGDLDTLDEAQLTDISDGLSSRFEALREKRQGDGLDDDEMAEFREQVWPNLQAVRGQQQNRQARRDEANSEIDAAFSEYDATSSEPEQENGEGEQEGQETEGDQESTEESPEQVEQAAMAAAGGKPKAKTTTKPRVPEIGTTGGNSGTKTAGNDGRIPTVITAAADVSGYSGGSAVPYDQLGVVMNRRLDAMRTVGGGNGEQVNVVTLRASGVPDNRKLKRNDIGGNTNKLDAVTNQALVAAGGLCAPLAIDYSYQTTGVQGRPVRDSLPGFQAERGGIMFRPDVSPVTVTSGTGPKSATGFWTNDNDEHAYDTSNPPRKNVWIVDCPPTETAEVEAITLQTEWSNVTSRFDPETVQANQAAALIWHDRVAENHLLAQLQGMSKVMTSEKVLGAVCDMLVTLDRAQAYFRSAHRLGANVNLRAIMPFWVKHLLRADMARRMALDPMAALNVSDAQIDSMLGTRGLTPVWHLDGKDAVDTMGTSGSTTDDVPAQQYTLASANAAVPGFPTKVDILLHAEGCFTHLDGGTLDLGIVRDSTLIDKNRYRQFSETWEGVAKRGVEALRLIAQVAPTGETSGAITVPNGK